MVDLDRIHQRLQLLTGYLHELRRLRDLPVIEYLQYEVYAGRYLVQVAAQLDHNRSKQSILVWVWICVGALRVVEGRL